jgi:HPt (histidine-containing phosphotransfer) domain-containing protein
MYGLEKKGRALFEFDLEKDLKGNPTKIREMLKTVEGRIQEIKNTLRQGAESEDFDKFGILLHGYAALQRVLTRIANKK